MEPGLALSRSDHKGKVAPAQTGMAAPGAVVLGTAPVLDEELGEVRPALLQVLRVDRPQEGVLLHAVVEGLDEPEEVPIASDALTTAYRLMVALHFFAFPARPKLDIA
jgi:hypothetical protein